MVELQADLEYIVTDRLNVSLDAIVQYLMISERSPAIQKSARSSR